MNITSLSEHLEQYIIKNKLFYRKNKLLLAVSGGLDSMVLLHLLKSLEYNIAVAHCNFKLRGSESDYEEKFVVDKAKSIDIAVYTSSINTVEYAKINKLTIQEAARNIRYNFFNKLCDEYNYNFIVTAHHLDDRIETMFINLLRGTGIKGLTSIPVKNNRIVRPLLFATRKDILNYAKENNIEWCEDSSNNEDKYLRNQIRHYVIPVLLKLKNDFYNIQRDNFYRFERELQLIEDFIQINLEKFIIKKDDTIEIEKLAFNENIKLQKLLFYYLKKFGFVEKQVQELLADKIQVGKFIYSNEYIIIVDRNVWILKQKNFGTNNSDITIITENF